MVREIKKLIKEAKKEGKTGTLDLTSPDVTDRQVRKKRSNINRTKQRNLLDIGDDDYFDDAASADGLIAAMSQLAWEKDIDLTKGKTFAASKEQDIAEELTERSTKMTPVDVSNTNNNNAAASDEVAMTEMRAGAGGSGGKKRTSKVSPELPALDPVLSHDDDSTPATVTTPLREGSGGSTGSWTKGSAGKQSTASSKKSSAAKSRKKVFTISGSDNAPPGEKTSNSASSLTALLHAWDDSKHDTTDV